MAEDLKKQICMNFPVWLIDKVDEQANKLGLNRTSMIILMVNEYMKQTEVIKGFDGMSELIKAIEKHEKPAKK